MFFQALGEGSGCLPHICCWTILATNLIHHSTFHSLWDRVLHPDKHVSQGGQGPKLCSDVNSSEHPTDGLRHTSDVWDGDHNSLIFPFFGLAWGYIQVVLTPSPWVAVQL